MKIIAIDPGTLKVGYCVLDCRNRRFRSVAMDTIRPRSKEIHKRLKEIEAALDRLFRRHRPAHIVLERAYVGRNANAALRLGEGRGVALAAAGRTRAEVFEYTAMEAKRAVTATGRAAKSAVQRSVQLLLGLKKPPEQDASDACALAICHASKHLGP
ncbi:MAG: crossover junction endodeoxyribonuclease RuvC [Planctomycetota bacterium]|jgi:crossover junction endodeoxyribonuclease RuvC